ncbi:MFS transporter [Variovorax sp. J22P240]|uniref:MFS transporter n=1 Tax=Variovorax sp. J22P240 TaxID=3053514 RepID=UPI00257627DF|nr:MFS transporter [Variovorax sp. J22P240]MDM0002878.1 MFS transporter [Variovorax sp. J22P240]
MNSAKANPKAAAREWIGLAVIALPCLLYSMDLTVLNLAVPHLSAALRPTSAQMLWIVDIYGFMLAGSLITMGTLGDRIGRRKLLLIGAACFGIASVLAAFSTSSEMLIATRALLGIAGATLAPSTLSLIRNMFLDAEERTVAIGIWVASFAVGGAIGPLVGGLLLEHYWWGSVFLVGVPVMALLLVLGPLLLPEYRDEKSGRLDLPSAALSLVAVLAVIYGLKRIAEAGMGALPVGVMAAGVAIGFAFIRRQRRLADPLIDLRLFRAPAFSAALLINTLGFFVGFAAFLLIAQYLQLVLGLSPLKAGLWSVSSSLAFIVGSNLVPRIVRRVRPGFVVAGGLVLAAAGFGLLAGLDRENGLPMLIVGYVILSLGLSFVFTLAVDMLVGTAPPERAGAASAISETSSELGGALGIAVLGSVIVGVYRHALSESSLAGVPPAAAEAARSSLGAAADVAAGLAGAAGDRLMEASREAFAQAFETTASISAAVALAAALLAAIMLRGVGTPPAPASAQGEATLLG